MSNIKFTMKDLDGTVMPYTSFVISTSASANAASFTTNLNGEATVSLAAVSTPYYISKQDGTTESVIAYKFFVPDTTYTLDAELLFVDMGKISMDKNDKSIAALIEAKVVAVNAANRALQFVSVLVAAQNAAQASANAAVASFDSFDERYLGAKTVAPTLDNDGNTLLVGAKYFNSTENKMYFRNSANAWQWDTADASGVNYLPAGTGAVATTVQSKLRDSKSVLDFMTDVQRADVIAGAQLVDVSDAFNQAASVCRFVEVPGYKYLVNNEVQIDSNQTWMFHGAELKHTDDTKHILRSNNKTGWAILGKVVLRGTLVSADVAAEAGLYITSGNRYRVEGVESREFKGKGIWLDGTNTGLYRGDRGQFTDCAAYQCTVGRQIDAGAEYTTWTNFNASGCITGDAQAGGNVVTVGGSIVDNNTGVKLTAGANHLHGMHVGVNINHNTIFNIEAVNVTNGHDFLDCHLYGDGGAAGALFFNNSKGISVKGGHLDCRVYNYSGGSSGYNFISDAYCPGSYGDVVCIDAANTYPSELVVQRCTGPGAYRAGVTINDPGSVYVWANREPGVTQAISGHTTLIFPSSAFDRRRAYNTATGMFTTPVGQAGQYTVKGQLYFSGTAMSASGSYVEVLVNDATPRLVLLTPYSTTMLTASVNLDLYLNTGDMVTLKAAIAGTSPMFGGASWLSSLAIQRIA